MIEAAHAFAMRYLVAALVALLVLSGVGLAAQRHSLEVLRTDLANAVSQRDVAKADVRSQNAGIELMHAEATAAAERVHTAEAKAALVGINQKPLPVIPPGGCTPAATWARAPATKAQVLENWK
jgi:hypothetical protein